MPVTPSDNDAPIRCAPLSRPQNLQLSQAGEAMTTMSMRAYPLALPIPQSKDAYKALKDRVNHVMIANQPLAVSPSSAQEYRMHPFPLSLRIFFGRRAMSFGTARRNAIVLPSGDGVEVQHLYLHFELQTSLLLLTDSSYEGTWICSHGSASPKLLHHSTWPFLTSTSIKIGHQLKYHFEIRLTEDQRHGEAFTQAFERYITSLQLSLTLFIKPLSFIQDPLVLDGGFIRLHRIGAAKYERVSTYLELSKGRLSAVKIIVWSGQPLLQHALSRSSTEATILRALDNVGRHLPCTVCAAAGLPTASYSTFHTSCHQ